MKFVLIMWLVGNPQFSAIEFDTQAACTKAAETVKANRGQSNFGFVCVPKGDRATP